MEQQYYDDKTGIWYELQGAYYLPMLTLEEEAERAIGRWGTMRLRYLKEHKKGLYTALLLNGTLPHHLAEIDKHADEMYSRLVEQMAEQERVTERLKAEDQMEWVRRVNNIRFRAAEIVNVELICA